VSAPLTSRGIPYRELAILSREVPWTEAVRRSIGPAEAYAWTVEDNRSAPALLSMAGPESSVLDTACQHGTYVCALAKVTRKVIASDPDPWAVRFVASRAKQERLSAVRSVIGRPEDTLRPSSIDLLLIHADLTPADRIDGLLRLLKSNGRVCQVGDSDPKVRKRLRAKGGLRRQHEYLALPDACDVRALADTGDSRGISHLLRSRYPSLPIPGWVPAAFFKPVSLTLSRLCRPRLCITLGPESHWDSGIHELARTHLAEHLNPGDRICLPIVYANRGTFTVPVFAGRRASPSAVLRIDAGRGLALHEAEALSLIARRAESALSGTVPQLLWKGCYGSRGAAFYRAVKGKPLRPARSAGELEKQLDDIVEWLLQLQRVPVSKLDLSHPSVVEQAEIYASPQKAASLLKTGRLSSRLIEAQRLLGAAGHRRSLIHGDLHPGNVARSARSWSVLDWEYASVSWPAFDWMYYFASSIVDGAKSPTAETAVRLLNGALRSTDPRGIVLARSTRRLLEGFGLTDTQVAPFTWIGLFDFFRRRYGASQMEFFEHLLDGVWSKQSL